MSDDVALFELARAETKGDEAWGTNFTRAVEKQVRAAIVLQLRTDQQLGACSASCTIQPYDVTIWSIDPTTAGNATHEVLAGMPLHACVAGICTGSPALHRKSRQAELELVQHTLVGPRSAGGGLYFCKEHCRAHICESSSCRYSVSGQRGVRICALSGRSLGLELNSAFGTGNRVMPTDIALRRDAEETQRRNDMTMRRSTASMGIEAIINMSNAQLRQTIHLGKRKADEISTEQVPTNIYIDTDIPDDNVFPESGVDNTFGDGLASDLARYYAQAYAAVHLLLFSEQRAAIEYRNNQATIATVNRLINAYKNYQQKHGQPVLLTVCRQLELRTMNARHIYPTLVLPPNAIARMTAYYALICVEVQLQLARCATKLIPKLAASLRKRCEQFCAMTTTTITPNILSILVEGMNSSESTIAERDAMMAIFPEPQTIQELGISQKTCTACKKSMNTIFMSAISHGIPMNDIRFTQIDIKHIQYSKESVVSLFLAARRRRLSHVAENPEEVDSADSPWR